MKIETHDLIKRYGSRTVVDHVNVEVEQGSIVGLLGTERGRQDDHLLYDRRHHPAG